MVIDGGIDALTYGAGKYKINRETLLMYYFLEMNNEEIAKKQNISRSGVFQNRHNSLALMKKLLKEKQ